MEEKQRKKSADPQVKEEKSNAALQRDNLLKSISDKRTFAEVVDESTESDSSTPTITILEKRRKIKEARSKGKETERNQTLVNQLREYDRETFSGMKEFMREMCQVLQPAPATPAASATLAGPPPAAPAPLVPDIRLQNVERAIDEVRETQRLARIFFNL